MAVQQYGHGWNCECAFCDIELRSNNVIRSIIDHARRFRSGRYD